MIRITGVAKRFGAGGVVLDGTDLTIGAGEIFGIIGRSGAGKSTLLRLFNGLERPDEGQVLIRGEDIGTRDGAQLRAVRRRVAMVFQNFGLLSSRTVEENVALPLRIAGVDRTAIAERVAELIDRVGLADHRRKYPAQLSGGQKQRVGIARALATSPEVLLCDEVTSALDPETTRSILDLLSGLNRELGLTIVLITHEMDVIRRICDRVAVLEAGRVAEIGTTAEVLLSPRAATTRAMLAETDRGVPIETRSAMRILRFTTLGAAADHPVLSSVARETGVDIAILGGQTGRLRDQAYSQLTLGLSGDGIDAAVARLASFGRVEA